MAGNYPDPPGYRLPWDKDGTQAFIRWDSTNGGAFEDGAFSVTGSPISEASLRAMNNEGSDSLSSGSSSLNAGAMCIIFPSPRDITHILICHRGGNTNTWEWSVNTTNGVDGTWTPFSVAAVDYSRPVLRSAARLVNLTGVKALRFVSNCAYADDQRYYALHFLGKPSNLYSNRLMFMHHTDPVLLHDRPGYLDWGDRPRESIETKSVRVVNMSLNQTAVDTVVTIEAPTDANPTFVSQHQMRYDGGSYGSTINIPALGPQEVSKVIDIKQTLLDTAVLSLWTQRVLAVPTAWE